MGAVSCPFYSLAADGVKVSESGISVWDLIFVPVSESDLLPQAQRKQEINMVYNESCIFFL